MSIKFKKISGTELRKVVRIDEARAESEVIGLIGEIGDLMRRGIIFESNRPAGSGWIVIPVAGLDDGMRESIVYPTLAAAKASIPVELEVLK